MKQGVHAVCILGQRLAKVAKDLNISESTLRDHVKGKAKKCIAGKPPTLTNDEEHHLLTYINNMGKWGWPLTLPCIFALAREVIIN